MVIGEKTSTFPVLLLQTGGDGSIYLKKTQLQIYSQKDRPKTKNA
jgi:hypothetical protein